MQVERFKRALGIPPRADSSEPPRRFDRRDFRHALRSVRQQDRGVAIYARVRQHDFAEDTEAKLRILQALFLRQHTDDRTIVFEKQEGRQQRLFPYFSG